MKNEEDSKSIESDSPNGSYKEYDVDYDPEWDEWYDSNEIENKKNKIKKSNRRLSKNRDEW